MKRRNISFRVRRVWFNFGWYRGDPFKLIGLTVGELLYPGMTIFNLQIAKFIFAFGWSE